MKVYVDEHPSWMDWIAPERFDDADLYRIVTFFVFHSPCTGLSSMGKTLAQYGWSNPWRKPYHLNRQLKHCADNFNLYYSVDNLCKMDEALKRAGLDCFPPVDDNGRLIVREALCFHDNNSNQSLSAFYHIRNSFAHCRLNMVDVNGECLFLMEDVKTKDKKGPADKKILTSRMVIKKSTLLKWIDLIEGGEREYIKQEADQ